MQKIARTIYEGEVFSLEFYVKSSGHCPAEEWLEDLPENIQAKFAALFVWIGDHGRISNERKFKHLSGSNQIFEFKAENGRLLCFFFFDKRIILTNGFVKKSDKTPGVEIERAERYKKEFESREQKS